MIETKHPFEQAGLGRAPFYFTHITEAVVCDYPGGPTHPNGRCDFCGMAIRYCCHICSDDGREFVVGTDCVRKTDQHLPTVRNATEMREALRDHKANLRREKAKARKERERAMIKQAFARYDANPHVFHDRPHPSASMAQRGLTLGDYIEWIRIHAGHTGRLAVARIIERQLGEPNGNSKSERESDA